MNFALITDSSVGCRLWANRVTEAEVMFTIRENGISLSPTIQSLT